MKLSAPNSPINIQGLSKHRSPQHALRRLVFSTSLFIALGLSLASCGGAAHLTSQLKTAQHERDVLRDAYEAQQLRLRELELRLLKLEDQQLIGARDTQGDLTSQRPNRPTATSYVSSQRSSRLDDAQADQTALNTHNRVIDQGVRRDRPDHWRAQRLRALPVVRVSASQALSASSDLEREPMTRKSRARKPERMRTTRRRHSRSSHQSKRSKTELNTHDIPTLTSRSAVHEHDPERTSLTAPVTSTAPPAGMERPHRPQSSIPAHEHNARPQSARTFERATPRADLQATQQTPAVHPPVDLIKSFQRQLATSTSASERAPLLLKLAAELRRRGRANHAMRLMKRLISESPTHSVVPDALYLMGRLYIEQGAEAKGKATLLRLSRLYPNARASRSAREFLKSQAR